jgi:hypothetical protein
MADTDDQAQLRTGSTADRAVPSADLALPGTAIGPGPAANGSGPRGKGSSRESDEIVAEIERTRENLARTIDALADRVSPASNVRRLKERATAEFAKPEVQLAAAAIALTITGVVIVRILSRRRGRRG